MVIRTAQPSYTGCNVVQWALKGGLLFINKYLCDLSKMIDLYFISSRDLKSKRVLSIVLKKNDF
jgi:hypothetical protein